jgi:hypothetical protein
MTILDFNEGARHGRPDRSRVDAADIKSRLVADVRRFLRLIYGGRVIFSSHDARIGDVHGKAGESCSISLKTGQWYDFATREGGSNLVDLYMAFRGYGQSSFLIALCEIAKDFFGDPVEIPRTSSRVVPLKEQIAEKKKLLGDKPRQENIELGAPVESYIYQNVEGVVQTVIRRYEPGGIDEKTGKPIKTFRAYPGMPTPRILYRLPQIIKAKHVVLTEGERKADALAAMGIEATTAMGGANTDIDKVDWSPLAGKIVTIWPDLDGVGQSYAERVAPVLVALGCRVAIVTPPADKPAKWDAYDCVKEGGDPNILINTAIEWPGRTNRGRGDGGAGSDAGGQSGGTQTGADAPLFNPWEAYIVPPFPFEVLPIDVQSFVKTQSTIIGCDPSALAMASLANFSAALDHRFRLKMMRHGNWWVSPRLWVLLVGDPSRKKNAYHEHRAGRSARPSGRIARPI